MIFMIMPVETFTVMLRHVSQLPDREEYREEKDG